MYVDLFGEGVVMGCGTGDHYASTPSKVVLRGYVVVAVEMLLLEKKNTHWTNCVEFLGVNVHNTYLGGRQTQRVKK